MLHIFENEGSLDLRAISITGLSDKLKSDSIGQFGSGFSYAIAYLLRQGAKVWIITDGVAYEAFTDKYISRNGDAHKLVMLRSEGHDHISLNVTTNLARNWQAWQAFRELYANMLDEGGTYYSEEGQIDQPSIDRVDKTTVIVDYAAFDSIVPESLFWKPSTSVDKQIAESESIAVFECGDHPELRHGHVFFHGVRVTNDTHRQTNDHFPFAVELKLKSTRDKLSDDRVLTPTEYAFYLCNALIRSAPPNSKAFIWLLHTNSFIANSAMPGLDENRINAIRNVVTTVANEQGYKRTPIVKRLEEQCKIPENERLEPNVPEEYAEMLEAALKHTARMGVKLTTDHIQYSPSRSNPNLLGACDMAQGIVILYPASFHCGLRMLVHALLHEYGHYTSKADDFEGRFQEALVDQTLTAYQKLTGEYL